MATLWSFMAILCGDGVGEGVGERGGSARVFFIDEQRGERGEDVVARGLAMLEGEHLGEDLGRRQLGQGRRAMGHDPARIQCDPQPPQTQRQRLAVRGFDGSTP